MLYKDGIIINDLGVPVPVTASVSSIILAAVPDAGEYSQINLTSGLKIKSGVINGRVHPQVLDPAVTGLNLAIAADASFIAAEITATSEYNVKIGRSLAENVIDVLNGTINATAGVTTVLNDGSSLFIKSPLPAIAMGASTTIALPTMTHMIGVTGIAVLTNANVVTAIGAGNGLGTGVSWEKFGPGLVIIADGTVVTAGGYVAVNFIP